MMKAVILIFALVAIVYAAHPKLSKIQQAMTTGTVQAGAAKVDATLPLGTPLAGYNHGERRVKYWPLPDIKEYTTWMTGSTGVLEPTFAKALVLDIGGERIAFVTLDGIGADGSVCQLAWELAADQGFTIPMDNVIFSASHTHSGPGAISPEMLWAIAPATDLLVPSLQNAFAGSIAKAMVAAEQSLAPANLGMGSDILLDVTQNRRSSISHTMNRHSIDPNLGLIRVDKLDGTPIATLWNFAIHGVCYGPENMQFSGDIMGVANEKIESIVGGISLFMNADAGDIDPADGMCDGAPNFAGSNLIAQAVAAARKNLTTVTQASVSAASVVVPFGPTNLNATLSRFNNCTHGGPLDVCGLCEFLRCDLNAHLPANWVEDTPRFTAIRLDVNGQKNVVVTMPGEPLLELGWWVRNDTASLGFDRTFIAGYSNSHMGYFATPDEYDIGGYESQLTFWGINTANMVRDGALNAAKLVAP